MGIQFSRMVGPYQLEVSIGHGGMGAVYRAYDQRLERRVAVKHIRPDHDVGRNARRRLRREARAAAALAHPSIIQVFDILEDEEGEWIVMEWIDGPSLARLIEDGPLDVSTAVAIAVEVAEGLAHAHDHGIIHRDLKAENVMISPLGQAKILDFGLAKRLTREDDSLTASGSILGTRRAMSPEQAQGFEVDERSDLFSLGVLLYECLTGVSPFRAPSDVTTLTRVCTQRQKPVASLIAGIPEDLSQLVDHMLEKLPGQRPRSARRVAARLASIDKRFEQRSERSRDEACESPTEADTVDFVGVSSVGSEVSDAGDRVSRLGELGVGGGPQLSGTGSVSRFWPSWRRLTKAGAVALLLTVLGPTLFVPGLREIVGRWLLHSEAGTMDSAAKETSFDANPGAVEVEGEQPLRIVVLPFENLGAPENAYFAAGITEEISRRLTLISGLGVISRTSAAHYADTSAGLQAIGRDLDVDYVLEGTVNWPPSTGDSASKIRITPRLARVADDLQIWTEAYERKLEDFLQLQSEIAAAVATTLDLSLEQTERRALDARGTEIPAAYHAYLRGLDYRQQPQYSAQGLNKAAKMFEYATDLDPTFAEAHAELSRVYSFLYYNNDGSEAKRSVAADALLEAQKIDPTLPEVRLASAYFKFQVEKDFAVAAEEFDALATDLPNHAEVLAGLGYTLIRQGRFEEAIAVLERSFVLDPVNEELALIMGELYHALRQFSAADKWLVVAQHLAPDFVEALKRRALNTMYWKGCKGLGTSEVKCSTEEAWQVIEDSPVGDDPALYYSLLRLDTFDATLKGPEGANEAFSRIVERLGAKIGRLGPSLDDCSLFWYEALSLERVGRHDEAIAFVEACRVELEVNLERHHTAHPDWARLSVAEAYLGRREEALQASATAIALSSEDHYLGPRNEDYLLVSLVFLGDMDRALELLNRLLKTPYKTPITTVSMWLDPVLEPLRKDPRFQAIWSSFGAQLPDHELI